jgi:hypothetical protein
MSYLKGNQNLGMVSSFGRGVQLHESLRSRGLQHTRLGRANVHGTSFSVGLTTYDRPLSLTDRLVQRGREMQVFGMGRERRPRWYEVLFEHMENFGGQFVLQILQMSFGQQRAGWDRQDQRSREKAYQTMIMDLANTKAGGTSRFSDPRARSFLQSKFSSESKGTQEEIIDKMTAGDPEMKAALRRLLDTPWYMDWKIMVPVVGVTGAIVMVAIVSSGR